MWGWLFTILAAMYCAWLIWKTHRRTAALRRAACIIMGLPLDTPMKEFERMHRGMRQSKTDDN